MLENTWGDPDSVESKLNVAQSGAKCLKVIKVLGGFHKSKTIGDVVVCSVREAILIQIKKAKYKGGLL